MGTLKNKESENPIPDKCPKNGRKNGKIILLLSQKLRQKNIITSTELFQLAKWSFCGIIATRR